MATSSSAEDELPLYPKEVVTELMEFLREETRDITGGSQTIRSNVVCLVCKCLRGEYWEMETRKYRSRRKVDKQIRRTTSSPVIRTRPCSIKKYENDIHWNLSLVYIIHRESKLGSRICSLWLWETFQFMLLKMNCSFQNLRKTYTVAHLRK